MYPAPTASALCLTVVQTVLNAERQSGMPKRKGKKAEGGQPLSLVLADALRLDRLIAADGPWAEFAQRNEFKMMLDVKSSPYSSGRDLRDALKMLVDEGDESEVVKKVRAPVPVLQSMHALSFFVVCVHALSIFVVFVLRALSFLLLSLLINCPRMQLVDFITAMENAQKQDVSKQAKQVLVTLVRLLEEGNSRFASS